MVRKDYLTWILDTASERYDKEKYLHLPCAELKGEDQYKANIDFVHSLGLKCDCVGWSGLDLARSDAGEIIDKIECFCREKGFVPRGGYGIWYEDYETDWYQLLLPEYKGDVQDNDEYWGSYKGLNKFTYKTYAAQSYKCRNLPALQFGYWDNAFMVSDRFREFCIDNGIEDIEFCRIRDYGKFHSDQQYSYLFPKQMINKAACGEALNYSDNKLKYDPAQGRFPVPHDKDSEIYRKFEQIGGYLPRLAELFYDLRVSLERQYPKNEMPDRGFACAVFPEYRPALLIHRSTAEMFMREKLLKPEWLTPVPLYTEVPIGYIEQELKTSLAHIPPREHIDVMESEYIKIKQLSRPIRKITEKEAVSLLRNAKSKNKDNYGKRMKKEIAESLVGTPYEPLIKYYLAADGGQLSDEYEFLSYADAQLETAEFRSELDKEELLSDRDKLYGIVTARCADGDRVILTSDGRTLRFSHEVPEVSEEWDTLPQFFEDAIETEEN